MAKAKRRSLTSRVRANLNDVYECIDTAQYKKETPLQKKIRDLFDVDQESQGGFHSKEFLDGYISGLLLAQIELRMRGCPRLYLDTLEQIKKVVASRLNDEVEIIITEDARAVISGLKPKVLLLEYKPNPR